MRARILGMALLTAVWVVPPAASAGIVITDLREGRPAPSEIMTNAVWLQQLSFQSEVPGDFRTVKSDESESSPSKITRYELSQLQQGLINDSDLAQGCGGASVTAGPAGLLPLLVAGFGLLRRKRRK